MQVSGARAGSCSLPADQPLAESLVRMHMQGSLMVLQAGLQPDQGRVQGIQCCDCYVSHEGRSLDASSSPAALQLAEGAEVQIHFRLRCGSCPKITWTTLS